MMSSKVPEKKRKPMMSNEVPEKKRNRRDLNKERKRKRNDNVQVTGGNPNKQQKIVKSSSTDEPKDGRNLGKRNEAPVLTDAPDLPKHAVSVQATVPVEIIDSKEFNEIHGNLYIYFFPLLKKFFRDNICNYEFFCSSTFAITISGMAYRLSNLSTSEEGSFGCWFLFYIFMLGSQLTFLRSKGSSQKDGTNVEPAWWRIWLSEFQLVIPLAVIICGSPLVINDFFAALHN